MVLPLSRIPAPVGAPDWSLLGEPSPVPGGCSTHENQFSSFFPLEDSWEPFKKAGERHGEGPRVGRWKNQERLPRLIPVPREGTTEVGDGAAGEGMEGLKGKENLDDPSPSPHPKSAFPARRNTGHGAVQAPQRGQSQGMPLPPKYLLSTRQHGYFWPFLAFPPGVLFQQEPNVPGWHSGGGSSWRIPRAAPHPRAVPSALR